MENIIILSVFLCVCVKLPKITILRPKYNASTHSPLIWVDIFIEIVANGTETNLIIIGNAYEMLNTHMKGESVWWMESGGHMRGKMKRVSIILNGFTN